MNIYQKMNEARIRFQQSGVKMSGYNGHLKFHYFTLDDILPAITKICAEIGLFNQITFLADKAEMRVVDTDVDINEMRNQIVFQSPIADANIQGGSPVQSLGAMETYIRRYLYVMAYEIVEPEVLDQTIGDKNLPAKKVGSNGIEFPKGSETPEQEEKRIRDIAWDLLQNSNMPTEAKDKWLASFSTLPIKAINGLLDRLKAEGVKI